MFAQKDAQIVNQMFLVQKLQRIKSYSLAKVPFAKAGFQIEDLSANSDWLVG